MIQVLRDMDAILIPVGTPVLIPQGSTVHVTQDLGGSVTVSVGGNLARVAHKDLDALGLAESNDGDDLQLLRESSEGGTVDESAVWAVLKSCYDPEIPVNIVDLGLIYDVLVVDADDGSNVVEITMTLTAPGCGMGPFIVDDVRQKVMSVPLVDEVCVELVFDPAWDRSMMSDEAKLQLGMF